MIRTRLGIALTVLAALLLLAGSVLAYTYRATFTVVESNGNSYAMLAVQVAANIDWMASEGFIASNGLDTRVESLGGVAGDHMLAADRILAAMPVGADGQANRYFTTGNSALASMPVITGYGGYFYTPYYATMDIGGAFDITLNDTYFDTSTADLFHIRKEGSFWIRNNPAGTVKASMLTLNNVVQNSDTSGYGLGSAYDTMLAELYTPLSLSDVFSLRFRLTRVGNPAGTAYFRVRVADGNPGTLLGTMYELDVSTVSASPGYGYYPVAGSLPTAAIFNPSSQSIRLTIEYSGGDGANYLIARFDNTNPLGGAQLSRYSGAAWSDEAGNDMNFYVTYATENRTVSGAVASGEHDLTVDTSGGNMRLTVDTIQLDSVALAGATAPAVGRSWLYGQDDTLTYVGDYQHTVGGTLIARYSPVDIVRGQAYATGTVTVTNGSTAVLGAGTTWTAGMEGSLFVSTDGVQYVVDTVTDATHLDLTAVYGGGTLAGQSYNMYVRLPDREGTAQDARIVWGANPAGVTVTLGSLTSASQPSVAQDISEIPVDVLPAVGVSDWFVEPDVGGALLTNPLRPFVTILSDNSSLTERQSWTILGGAIVLLAMAITMRFLRGHWLVVGSVGAASILAMVVFTIFPLWMLVFVVAAIVAGMVMERSPSL